MPAQHTIFASRTNPSSLPTPPARPQTWPTAIQLADAVATDNTSTAEIRGLTTAMSVTHEGDETFHVYDGTTSVTVDTAAGSCSCDATTTQCRHLWHIRHRLDRGLIPSRQVPDPSQLPAIHDTINDTSDTTTDTPDQTVACDACGTTIDTISAPQPTEQTLCFDCLRTSDAIYHVSRSPTDEPALVYASEPISSTPIAEFYPSGNTMSVYEFFADDNRVSPSDTPIKVHFQITDFTPQTAFGFHTDARFVPDTTLSTPTLSSQQSSLWLQTRDTYTATRNPSVQVAGD